MWVCTHCHEEVEDVLTSCWNCGHSRDYKTEAHWCEQFKTLKKEVKLQVESKPRNFNRTRLKAFLIDYLPFVVLWGITDNVVCLPISEKVMEIISVALFCIYFVLIEGLCIPRTSGGKRVQGLRLVSWTGDEPGVWTVVLRSLIIASLIIVDWYVLINNWPVPAFVPILTSTIPIGIILYNLWLAVRSPEGLMLQDRLTGTKVVWETSVEKEKPAASNDPPTRPDFFPKPWYAVGFVLVPSLIGLLFSVFLFHQLDSEDLWKIDDTAVVNIATALESHVADELGVRCVIGLTSEVIWSKNGSSSEFEKERGLIVEVWIPVILWDNDTRVKVRDVVLEYLTIKPGFYDSGEFKTTTGIWLFNWTRTTNLTMP